MDAIHSSSVGISEFHFIVMNIRALLGLNYNFEVEYVHRQTNMVGHSLAKAAISNASRRIWY